ncbi:SusC/RagA family TonB-linked outer membrane protein [Parabacteroides faecis]|uniref:SusC/RagA family TonB-linked outer membrane protein n=1 Tax=Parabacteroides faecis TaxID=1217282 RepID=UPI0035211A90
MNYLISRTIYVLKKRQFSWVKLVLFILLISPSLLGQISVSIQKQTLRQALKAIERSGNYQFFYNEDLSSLDKIVSLTVKDAPVEEVLDKLLYGTDITYKKEKENLIVLTLKATSVAPQQENRTVKGTVVDATGEPVIGANVVEKGTTNGTVTDMDGKFALEVSADATLSISYIGYTEQLVPVKNQSTFDIKLMEDTQKLEEIVVVGYGAQKKVNLTGSVASISSQELVQRPITSVASGIQGIVPGLTITAGQGRPGSSDNTSIRVRGTGTLNNSDPYILIDGIESGSMNQIDPNDIESISVLKDAASAAIYGSKAANGVILITTKRGSSGRPVVAYNATFGWQTATGFVERMNSADAATYYNKALESSGKAPRFTEDDIRLFRDGTDPYGHPDTDWNDLGFAGNGFMHQHNINLSGGSENIKYMASVGYLNQNGIMKHSNREQFNMRTNLDAKLSDHVNVRANMSFIHNDYADPTNSYVGGGSDQIIRQLNRIAPWIPYKNEDGTYGTIGDGNPVAWLDLDQTLNRNNQNFSGILAVDYNVMKGLKFTAQGAYVSDVQDRKEFVKDIQYNSIKYHGPNSLDERTYLWNRTSLDLLMNYDKSFGNHNLKAMVGYRIEKYNYKYTKAYRKGFPNNDMTDINAGTQSTQTNEGYSRELAMMSYFGRVNYDYAGKYLFEANFRADASSRFSPDNRWGYFPSLSAGWRMSEEGFMEGARDWMQSLKLRASWGQLGNQEALDDYYPWLITYAIGSSSGGNYPFDGNVNTGIMQKAQKLSSISWEKSSNWGIGFDLSVLSCLDLTLDYYNRKTTGIIMDVPVPGSFGLDPYKDNVGAMRNSGFEVTASFHKRWNDWTFGATGNMAVNKNEILNLGGVNEMVDKDNAYFINRVGAAYKSFYGYVADGLFRSQEEADAYTEKYGNPFGNAFKAGDIKYKDVNGDGKLTSADRDVAGSEQPNVTFGLNLSASWKNFDLSVFMQGACGVSRYFNNEVFGEFTGDSSHPSTAWFDAWSPENPDGTFPRVAESDRTNSTPSNYSTFWIFKTNYLRIKNIQFGYNLPDSWLKGIGISRAKIYYSGENLFKFDNLPVNIDPEAPSGRGSHYPQVCTNSIGVNITF